MTQQAPERIWAQDANPEECNFIGGGWWDDECSDVQYPNVVEYLRADLAPSPEAFQQMREALEKIENIGLAWSLSFEAQIGEARAIARAALKAADDDAQAALNRMLRRAKNEALEAAAERFHTEQLRIYADEILGSLSMDNVLRIETYDEKVLAYQSVAIELAAFPAAIRAMKEPEE